MDYETANFIVLIINTFMCLSSPLNLAVYCGMSNQFREQFTKIMTSSCGAPNTGLGPLVSVQLTLTQVPLSRREQEAQQQRDVSVGNK